MSGGIWTTQDKIRPGAYVRFSAIPTWDQSSPGTGVVTMPLNMSWGPLGQIMEIESADMLNGNAEKIIGYPLNSQKNLALTEALCNCRKVLLYRINNNAYKASATLGSLQVSAKYPGLRGNDIKVAVIAENSSFNVITYVDEEEKDNQIISESTLSPISNDWVDFSLSGTLAAAAATALTGGSDGTTTVTQYNEYFSAIKNKDWQVMACPLDDTSLPPLVKAYIYDLRENLGKKVQAVVHDYAADYEGIITLDQGYTKNGISITPVLFTAWVAGATAGANINESNTYKVIQEADSIINEVDDQSIEEKIQEGYFAVSRRTDGTIVAERDINSLVTLTANKSRAFSKNMVIRTLDRIANGIANMFETNYIGLISNTQEGRDLFKQDIIKFLGDMAATGAISDFQGSDDITVEPGNDSDSVIVTIALNPADAMEKLYVTLEVAA